MALKLSLGLVLLSVGLGALTFAGPLDLPEIIEEVEVAIVQVDVSVIDPHSRSRASVRGLTADDFAVSVDGRRLTDEQRRGLAVDEMCFGEDATPRPVIVVIDFNYIDAAGRGRVAEALGRIADAPVPGIAYKFYGLTREVRALTDTFVIDPEEIRRVAGLVRSAGFVGDHATLATVRGLQAGGAGGCSG